MNDNLAFPKNDFLLVRLCSALFCVLGKRLNIFLYNFFINTQGYVGIGIRQAIAKNLCKKVGINLIIKRNVIIRGWKHLEIGNYCTINENTLINAEGGVKIGNYCRIAYFSRIISDSHSYEQRDIPIAKQEVKYAPVELKDDVWLGTGAVIIMGVCLEKGCIIGANSVVTKNTEKYGVYGGVPAKLIKKR